MSLEDWPEALGTFFGINETTAALILSLSVIFAIVLPVMLLTMKQDNAVTIWLIFTFIGECVVLGLGWLPLWIMIMTIVITAIPIAMFGSRAIGGG